MDMRDEQVREILLRVENLHVDFKSRTRSVKALNGISFDIYRGETFGLVGETGCGKTVTGLSILGLIDQTGKVLEGKILFNNEDLLSISEVRLSGIRGSRIAMIFQDPGAALNPVFSVGGQIIDILRRHQKLSRRASWDKAIEMLSDVELPDPREIMKTYPHELSGGMQQRVMIAMALSSGAELLIADEPTTALDVTIESQILELMKRIQETHGLSIMLITHNIGLVAETCDRVGVLYAGNLVEVGNTVDVFKSMKHPYTNALLGAIPRPESRKQQLPAIPGTVPSGQNIPGCAFHPRCPHVMEICSVKRPRLVEIAEIKREHKVACHLYGGSNVEEI